MCSHTAYSILSLHVHTVQYSTVQYSTWLTIHNIHTCVCMCCGCERCTLRTHSMHCTGVLLCKYSMYVLRMQSAVWEMHSYTVVQHTISHSSVRLCRHDVDLPASDHFCSTGSHQWVPLYWGSNIRRTTHAETVQGRFCSESSDNSTYFHPQSVAKRSHCKLLVC